MKLVDTEKAWDKLKPESLVFVISFDSKNNRPSGMIAGWSMKCSSDPHMFAVAIWKQNYTYKLIENVKEFVIAVPNKKLQKYIEIFGTKHGDKVDKFTLSKISTAKSKFVKIPLLRDATVNLECKLEKEIEVGDHSIFIGKVLASHINENEGILLNMGKKNGRRVFQEFKSTNLK